MASQHFTEAPKRQMPMTVPLASGNSTNLPVAMPFAKVSGVEKPGHFTAGLDSRTQVTRKVCTGFAWFPPIVAFTYTRPFQTATD